VEEKSVIMNTLKGNIMNIPQGLLRYLAGEIDRVYVDLVAGYPVLIEVPYLYEGDDQHTRFLLHLLDSLFLHPIGIDIEIVGSVSGAVMVSLSEILAIEKS